MKLTHQAYLLMLVSFIADQLSKYIMLDVVGIAAASPIEVLPFFNLVMVWNFGVSFGMFADPAGNMKYFLIALSLLISGGLNFWLQKGVKRSEALAIGLIVGGALGNVIDRVRFGAVADFFDFHAYGWHYPAFNIADSCIFLGVATLLLDGAWPSRKPCNKDA